MSQEKMFALDERVITRKDCFDSLDATRSYDLDIRKSMLIPMERVSMAVGNQVSEGDKVLEVGCSTGLVSLMISSAVQGCEIIGVDDNENRLQVANENAQIASVLNSGAAVEFKCVDNMAKLPFADNSMDIVFSYGKLRTLPDPEVIGVLKEMKRVCKEDGLVYIYDIARDAEEGMIATILQYSGKSGDKFGEEIKAAFTTSEMQAILQKAELTDWTVALDRKNDVNMVITNKELK